MTTLCSPEKTPPRRFRAPLTSCAAALAAAVLMPALSGVASAAEATPPPESVAAAKPAEPLIPVAKTETPIEGPHGLALRARWLTVPGWSLGPYLQQHTQMDAGWSVALSYLYRRTGYDVVISLDYSSLPATNGNYLGAGNKAENGETHFLVFDGLSSLSADVSLIGHWNVLPYLELRAGGGLGVGGVFGDIYQITNSASLCTAANAGDPSKCYPQRKGQEAAWTPINDVNDPATLERLRNNACAGGDGTLDTPNNPCYRKTTTYPLGGVRVVPVINAVIGMRFKLYNHVYLNLDGGWRLVGFFAGGGPEFHF